MDASVVVLSWNTAALTLRALAAARRELSTIPGELVCVDNASDDDTVSRVRREAPDVRLVVNEANLGFARGNNRALPFVQGRYVVFLNSDARPEPGALVHVVRWLDGHPTVAAAAPRVVSPDGRPQRAARDDPSALGLLHRFTALRYTPIGRRAAARWTRGVEATAPREVDTVLGACLVVRRDALLALGGFDEGYPFYWEDVDLCRRLRREGHGVAWVPDGPPVVHEGGAASAARDDALRREMAVGLLRYARLHLGPREGPAVAALLALGIVLRALLEPVRLAAEASGRALAGRRGDARRHLARARAWLRFLEHDLCALLLALRPPRAVGR